MAREYTFRAVLNFSFSSHAELTSMRFTALTFAANNGGSADILTNEDSDNEIPYYGRLILELPVTSRTEASSKMAGIDSALSGLPDLVSVNGTYLEYSFVEKEV